MLSILNCCKCGGLLLALTCGLLAGCQATPVRTAVAANSLTNSAPSGSFVSISSEKLAQAHAHYAAGVIREINDETSAALDEYAKAAAADPQDEFLVLEVSARLLQAKQLDKALEITERAAAQPDAKGSIYARLGLIYSQLGKTEQALAANRTAVKRAPASLAGYQNLFVTYAQKKMNQEALKVLEDAEKQPHPDAEFLLGLSDLYMSFGVQSPSQKSQADARALKVLQQVEKLHPTNATVQLKLADGLSLLGASERAAVIYQDLLKSLPDIPQIRQRVHARLADIYLRNNDSKHAAEQLQEVLREDPTNPQANYWLGSIAFEEKRTGEAIEYFSKTTFLNPDFEPAYYDLASAQLELKKNSEALATLDAARHKFAQNFLLEYLTAIAMGQQKAYTEAIQHYTSAEVIAQATDPKKLNYLFYFQYGAAWERKGDYEQAEKYFQKCLQMAPDFDEAQNYLGYMWAEHGVKLGEARELIAKAVKAEPKNAAYLDSLSWVLFKLNQPKEALDYALKAIKFSEEPDPTVYDHLGDIYNALNQSDKAKEAWRKSLSLEDNEGVRKKLDAPIKQPGQDAH